MDTKELTIIMIKERIRVCKLIYGLRQLGLDVDLYEPQLSSAYIKLMGLEESDEITEHIYNYEIMASKLSPSQFEKKLDQLAFDLYEYLLQQ
jgi:hypothetical protein